MGARYLRCPQLIVAQMQKHSLSTSTALTADDLLIATKLKRFLEYEVHRDINIESDSGCMLIDSIVDGVSVSQISENTGLKLANAIT